MDDVCASAVLIFFVVALVAIVKSMIDDSRQKEYVAEMERSRRHSEEEEERKRANEETDTEDAVVLNEKHIEEFVSKNIGILEDGLRLIGTQYSTDVGRIDILAMDKHGGYVVIEIKKGKTGDRVVGQIQRYMSWVSEHIASGGIVRGIIVVKETNEKLEYSARGSSFPIEIKLFGDVAPISDNMMYCQHCGKQIVASAKFCKYCGENCWL